MDKLFPVLAIGYDENGKIGEELIYTVTTDVPSYTPTGYQLGSVPIWGDTTISDTTDIGIWSVTITNTNNIIYYLDATGEITVIQEPASPRRDGTDDSPAMTTRRHRQHDTHGAAS